MASFSVSTNARAPDRKAGFLLSMIRGAGRRWHFNYSIQILKCFRDALSGKGRGSFIASVITEVDKERRFYLLWPRIVDARSWRAGRTVNISAVSSVADFEPTISHRATAGARPVLTLECSLLHRRKRMTGFVILGGEIA